MALTDQTSQNRKSASDTHKGIDGLVNPRELAAEQKENKDCSSCNEFQKNKLSDSCPHHKSIIKGKKPNLEFKFYHKGKKEFIKLPKKYILKISRDQNEEVNWSLWFENKDTASLEFVINQRFGEIYEK